MITFDLIKAKCIAYFYTIKFIEIIL